jgi:hypothetical protein
MKLKEQILNNLQPLSEKEKVMVGVFLRDMYAICPSMEISLEQRSLKEIKCLKNPVVSVTVPHSKIESMKKWLIDEGFIVRVWKSPYGDFQGYKVYLQEEYAV